MRLLHKEWHSVSKVDTTALRDTLPLDVTMCAKTQTIYIQSRQGDFSGDSQHMQLSQEYFGTTCML